MPQKPPKDFNAMLHNPKDMPKIQIVTDPKTIQRYGGNRMFFAPPTDYDLVMRQVPWGHVTTAGDIRAYFARSHGADFTDPMTAGIFINLAAWASEQRIEDPTPYWRTLKASGELNDKYPGGILQQKTRLEAEGHVIVEKGRTNIRYFVQDYTNALVCLDTLLEASPSFQEAAIARIRQMETYYDDVTQILHTSPEQLSMQPVQEKILALSRYYEEGQWQDDYTMDEEHRLPKNLKRGVLSQDGLYDLLCALRSLPGIFPVKP